MADSRSRESRTIFLRVPGWLNDPASGYWGELDLGDEKGMKGVLEVGKVAAAFEIEYSIRCVGV